MVNFKAIEEKLVQEAKNILHEAESNEPTIGAAVRTALEGAGVPAPLATTAVTLVEGLLSHFINNPPPAAPEAPATTPVEASPAPAEVAPVAEPAPAEASTSPVAPAQEAAAPADPFAAVAPASTAG